MYIFEKMQVRKTNELLIIVIIVLIVRSDCQSSRNYRHSAFQVIVYLKAASFVLPGQFASFVFPLKYITASNLNNFCKILIQNAGFAKIDSIFSK